jgi:hypothetical protein
VGEINGTLVVDQKCGRLVMSELQIVKIQVTSGTLGYAEKYSASIEDVAKMDCNLDI